MPEMECTPGKNRPLDATGTIKSELMKKYFDLAQPNNSSCYQGIPNPCYPQCQFDKLT
jgi:hypothetical protein